MTPYLMKKEANRVRNISDIEKAIILLNNVQKDRKSALLADIINALSEMKDDIYNRKHNRYEPLDEAINKTGK